MLKLIKNFMAMRRKKQLKRWQRMNAEILCAIAHDVYKEQEVQELKVPAFMVINQRYNDLKITTPKELVKTYTQMFFKGAVSGIEL